MLIAIERRKEEKMPLEEEIKKVMQREVQRNDKFEKPYKNIRENYIRGVQIFKDNEGIFRAKGRVDTVEGYPALIGKEDKFLGIFLSHMHEKTLHSTAGTLWAETMKTFWTPGILTMCKKISYTAQNADDTEPKK
jgi:hypothetical protein